MISLSPFLSFLQSGDALRLLVDGDVHTDIVRSTSQQEDEDRPRQRTQLDALDAPAGAVQAWDTRADVECLS